MADAPADGSPVHTCALAAIPQFGAGMTHRCKRGSTQVLRDALRSCQAQFHREVVVPFVPATGNGRLMPEQRQEEDEPPQPALPPASSWHQKAMRKLKGVSTKNRVQVVQSRPSRPVSEDADRYSKLQLTLRELQTTFDEKNLSDHARVLVQHAFVLMHASGVRYELDGALQQSRAALQALAATMVNASKVSSVSDQPSSGFADEDSRKSALAVLDHLRGCLRSGIDTAQKYVREFDRLDEIMKYIENIEESGCAVNATILVGLVVAVHQLLDRWRREHARFVLALGEFPSFSGGGQPEDLSDAGSLSDASDMINIGDVMWSFELESAEFVRAMRKEYGMGAEPRNLMSEFCKNVSEAAANQVDACGGERYVRGVKEACELVVAMVHFFVGGVDQSQHVAGDSNQHGNFVYEDGAMILLLSNSMREAWLHSLEGPLLDDAEQIAKRKKEREGEKLARRTARSKARQGKRTARHLMEEELTERAVQYEIIVKTSDKRQAGTDANVTLVLYGKGCDSGEIPLLVDKRSGDKFERGEEDVFVVSTLWLSDLSKLRVWHDAVGLGSGWHLESIEVRDVLGRSYHFPCNAWLDNPLRVKRASTQMQRFRELVPRPVECKEQARITQDWREAALPKPHPVKLTNYEIKVYTSHLPKSGTDSRVRIMLFGEYGYSGPWELVNPWRDLFERGRVDEFFIEAICLGRIYAVQIGHDGSGMGSSWLLKQVIVRDLNCGTLQSFICEQWLGESHREPSDEEGDEDADSIESLSVSAQSDYALGKEVLLTCSSTVDGISVYRVFVKTGSKLGSGTDAHVNIRLFGKGNQSKWIPLELSLTHRNKFESENLDEFVVEIPYIGEVKRVSICHDGWGLGAGWYLEEIKVVDTMNDDAVYRFPCERWLDSGDGDCQIMRDLIQRKTGHQHMVPAIGEGKLRHITHYKVIVFTGQQKGSGTDAAVDVTLHGEHGLSGPWRLDRSFHDDFERGKIDTFVIEAAELGELQHIEIGHDGKHRGSSWYLETVFVRDELNGGEWEFVCRKWMDKVLSEDKLCRRTLAGKRTNFSQQKEWTLQKEREALTAWLKELRLSQHVDTFIKYELTVPALMALKDDHLARMKLPLADRARILKQITKQKREMRHVMTVGA